MSKNFRPCKFTGAEPSPKGDGHCAHLFDVERDVGRRQVGKDGNLWELRKKHSEKGTPYLNWFKVPKKKRPPAQEQKRPPAQEEQKRPPPAQEEQKRPDLSSLPDLKQLHELGDTDLKQLDQLCQGVQDVRKARQSVDTVILQNLCDEIAQESQTTHSELKLDQVLYLLRSIHGDKVRNEFQRGMYNK